MFTFWGKTKKVKPIFYYYPPLNLNSAEVYYLCNRVATYESLVSLVFYLANRGYITIEDVSGKFYLRKNMDYQGQNKIEKLFMSAIFMKGNSVSLSSLNNSYKFKLECHRIVSEMNNTEKSIFIEKSCKSAKKILLAICILGAIYALHTIPTGEAFLRFFAFVIHISFLFFIHTIVYNVSNRYVENEQVNKRIKLVYSIFLLVFLCSFGVPLLLVIILNSDIFLSLWCIFCSISSFFYYSQMKKLTKGQNKQLAYVLGFKYFINRHDVENLNSLQTEDSNYLSNIISYAYVLGFSKTIVPLLRRISFFTQPSWFVGEFSNSSFLKFSRLMLTAICPV